MRVASYLLCFSVATVTISGAVFARDSSRVVRRIAFGSCAHQKLPQPIWEPILRSRPDLFLFLGDNVYGDGGDLATLRESYAQLARIDGFRRLRRTAKILAIWDDHDYGLNDGGREYRYRAESQRIFLDFFQEPRDSVRRSTPGIYTAPIFGPPGRRLQIIQLDTRYFRDPLTENPVFLRGWLGRYRPTRDSSRTLLGEAQWAWLETQLRRPADLRLIASSIQILPVEQKFEKWHNLPHERERLFALLRRTRAGGVLLLSGDRHFAELSRFDKTVADLPYSLYEATSSGMTHAYREGPREKNSFRIGEGYGDLNFGLLEIDWRGKEPGLTLSLRDQAGATRITRHISFAELSPAR